MTKEFSVSIEGADTSDYKILNGIRTEVHGPGLAAGRSDLLFLDEFELVSRKGAKARNVSFA